MLYASELTWNGQCKPQRSDRILLPERLPVCKTGRGSPSKEEEERAVRERAEIMEIRWAQAE